MEILKTFPGDVNYHLFQKVPNLLYPADLISGIQDDMNVEFLESCLVIIENKVPKARLSIYNNPSIQYKKERVICIGNFECSAENKFSKTLLNYVFDQAKKQNYKFILGPINGSTWNNYRFKTNDNYPPFFLEPEHLVYYNNQFISSGFKAITEYTSYLIPDLTKMPLFDSNIQNKLKKQEITIRTINKNNYEQELKTLYYLSLESFSENMFYSPIKWESFIERYKPLKTFTNPEHTLIAENTNGEAVGFLFAIDDLFSQTEKRLIIKTVVHKKSIEYEGLGAAMLFKINKYAMDNQYNSLIHAFMISDSTFDTFSSKIGKIYRNYKLYIKEL